MPQNPRGDEARPGLGAGDRTAGEPKEERREDGAGAMGAGDQRSPGGSSRDSEKLG